MGAIAVSNLQYGVDNASRVVTADVTLSSSYATGGETIPLGQLGLQGVHTAQVRCGTLADSAQVPSKAYTPNGHGVQVVLAGTPTAPKLKVFYGAASEVANATNLSAIPALSIRFLGY